MDPTQYPSTSPYSSRALLNRTDTLARQTNELTISPTLDIDGTTVRFHEDQSVPAHHLTTIETTGPVKADAGWVESVVCPEILDFATVLENDRALRAAALEQLKPGIAASQQGSTIKAAWEVDAFRWPKVAEFLLANYSLLFDQIGRALVGCLQPPQTRLGICSSLRLEGKSTMATCLARWGTDHGLKTLLIDCDIAHPRLSYMSGLTPEFGWRAVLQDIVPVSEVMIRSASTGLTLIPLAWDKYPSTDARLLDEISPLLSLMKHEFDLVIIDLGTIENLCSYMTAGIDLVDQVLIVRDAQRTSTGQLMETQQVLHNLGFAEPKVVENFAR